MTYTNFDRVFLRLKRFRDMGQMSYLELTRLEQGRTYNRRMKMIELHVRETISHRFAVPGEAAAWIVEENIQEFEGDATEPGELEAFINDLREMGWGQ